jgi:hypothetical protein
MDHNRLRPQLCRAAATADIPAGDGGATAGQHSRHRADRFSEYALEHSIRRRFKSGTERGDRFRTCGIAYDCYSNSGAPAGTDGRFTLPGSATDTGWHNTWQHALVVTLAYDADDNWQRVGQQWRHAGDGGKRRCLADCAAIEKTGAAAAAAAECDRDGRDSSGFSANCGSRGCASDSNSAATGTPGCCTFGDARYRHRYGSL